MPKIYRDEGGNEWEALTPKEAAKVYAIIAIGGIGWCWGLHTLYSWIFN